MKKGIRLLFPTIVYEENLVESGRITAEHCGILKDAIDGMRKNDPVGRQISNAYTGWQSNDGCESNPAFSKLMRILRDIFNNEIGGFHGIDRGRVQISVGNCWANVNDHLAWNRPHLHNGCWYSGAFYVHSEGDEGSFIAVNTDPKVVADYPPNARSIESWEVKPVTGSLILFPSAMMHMVEPNRTHKDRYSISFNVNTDRIGHQREHQVKRIDEDWNLFNLDEDFELTK
tara:strand:- start:12445 stop:13134 length:690 start_codon:yes stop_codon:yes gene_type:complete